MAADLNRQSAGDYHALLSLHHGLRLRRQLHGGPGSSADAIAGVPTADNWPELREDQRALRESVSTIEPLQDALLGIYTALFRDRPHLRGLFPGSILAQRSRLTRYFLELIDNLDNPHSIVPAIENLGRDHRKLGVLAQHYTAFADALAEALVRAGGDRWTDQYHRAWMRLYWFTAKIMIDASERVTSDPPYFTGVVIGHQRLGPDLAIVRLRTTEPYRYQAGQHATLQSPLLPHAWRSYSMATPPTDQHVLEFHVRAKGVGGVSDALVKQTSIGDRLRVGPARGDLRAASIDGRDLLLVAGGTGLAPIRAILHELAERREPPRTSLFFGARTSDELYDLDLLTAYANRSPWLRLVPAVSGHAAFPFDAGDLPDVTARYGPWKGHCAVLAGPRAMVSAMLRILPQLEVRPEDIWYDPE